MDYFKQIKAFYSRQLINPLASPDISLWHALMYQSNSLGWPTEFNVPMSTLCIYTGLSTSAVKRSRNNLATNGLIKWHQRKGRLSASYSIVVLYEPQNEPQSAPQPVPQSAPQPVPQSGPIHKHKTENNIYSTSATTARERGGMDAVPPPSPPEAPGLAQAAQCYEANIGPLPRYVGERLMYWLDELNLNLVCEAIHRAAAANARSWNYAEKILTSWRDSGIRTVDAARMERGGRKHTTAPRAHAAPCAARPTADEVWSKISEGGEHDDQAGNSGFAAIDGEVLAEFSAGR